MQSRGKLPPALAAMARKYVALRAPVRRLQDLNPAAAADTARSMSSSIPACEANAYVFLLETQQCGACIPLARLRESCR